MRFFSLENIDKSELATLFTSNKVENEHTLGLCRGREGENSW
jgi:hypothetical protein